jgi:adsorption protein B
MVEFSYRLSDLLSVLTVVVAFVYLLLGIDDLVFDMMYWVRTIGRALRGRRFPKLTVEKLRSKAEQRIAIMIPCWHEHDVVERMLEFATTSLEYQHYDIFVGVYPNDEPTLAAVTSAAARHRQVRLVVNPLPGPTTKAQNLNSIFAEIERTEGNDPYEIMVLHDTEDVIHPLSLRMYNYLMPQRQMIQLPVFPLERPTFEWTSWTYADEFAENHLKDMVIREAMGGFVPSAGVGCAFSRPALEILSVTAEDVFPSKTLTEDYQTGLRLKLRGLSTIFVSQPLAYRRGQRYKTAASYIATRAYFPDRLETAVRQKSRWVVGICFEAWQATGWVGDFPMRYALYRDRKSVASNIFALFGYAVLAGVVPLLVWHHFDPRIVAPHVGNNRFVWALLDLVLTMTLWRLLQKAYFVSSLYGPVQGLLAVIRPPWSSFINGLATLRAIGLFTEAVREKRDVVWNKTDHFFPTDQVLGEFRRQLGQVLIESDKLNSSQLDEALARKLPDERLGDTLVRLGFVTERDVIRAVADQSGALSAVDDDLVPTADALRALPHEVAEDNCWLPLRIRDGKVLELAVNEMPNREETDMIGYLSKLRVEPRIVERRRLEPAIHRAYSFGDNPRAKPIGVYLVDRGYLTRETLEKYLNTPDPSGRRLLERAVDDDWLDDAALLTVVSEYFAVPVHTEALNGKLPSDKVVLEAEDLLRAHPGLVLLDRAGTLTMISAIPMDASIVDQLQHRFGTVATLVATRSQVVAERESIDERRQRLLVIR